ncbi:hypothetical protein [Baekduia sp. Peel2402]|uniref:hypothetical protein n=1 Tax=Baekduia sp. Peel2402 TaxID=3458296 RepID=UPI00403EE805
MSKVTRFVVLVVGVMSVVGALAASAQAVTWHNSASTSFTATAGPWTFSGAPNPLHCPNATMTGTVPSLSLVAVWVSGTITASNCVLFGVTTGVDCGYTLTGTTHSGGVTSGTVDMTCGVYQFGSKVCHIGGTVSGAYTNPGTAGVLNIATAGNLISRNGPSGSCPLGNGFTGHLSALSFRTTSANPPIITRTP